MGELLLYTVVPWKPKAKDRPRTGKNGHMYTPKATKDAERQFKGDFLATIPSERVPWLPYKGPIEIKLDFSNEHVAVRIYKAEDYEQRKLRADLDNYVKLVTDALNKTAYEDDRQIVAITARKA